MNTWDAVSFVEQQKQYALEHKPIGMRLWDIYPTVKYAKSQAKHYGFSAFATTERMTKHGLVVALYYAL